jgi:hypothetical protein
VRAGAEVDSATLAFAVESSKTPPCEREGVDPLEHIQRRPGVEETGDKLEVTAETLERVLEEGVLIRGPRRR